MSVRGDGANLSAGPSLDDVSGPRRERFREVRRSPGLPACEFCGVALLTTARGRPPRRCISCRGSIYREAYNAARRQQKPRDLVCARCGMPFTAKRGDRRYCSKRCKDGPYELTRAFSRALIHRELRIASGRYRRKDVVARILMRSRTIHTPPSAAIVVRICSACRSAFVSRSGALCSDACRREANRQSAYSRWLRYRLHDPAAACVRCGGPMTSRNANARYCGKRCARRHRKADRAARLAILGGWSCGICANPVEPLRRYPDPMSVSVDHIVPVSLGGSNRRDNVRAAHLICNIRRGDGLATESRARRHVSTSTHRMRRS